MLNITKKTQKVKYQCLEDYTQTCHISGFSWNSRFTSKELSFSGLMFFIMQSVVVKPGKGNSIMTSLSLYFNLFLLLNWIVQ